MLKLRNRFLLFTKKNIKIIGYLIFFNFLFVTVSTPLALSRALVVTCEIAKIIASFNFAEILKFKIGMAQKAKINHVQPTTSGSSRKSLGQLSQTDILIGLGLQEQILARVSGQIAHKAENDQIIPKQNVDYFNNRIDQENKNNVIEPAIAKERPLSGYADEKQTSNELSVVVKYPEGARFQPLSV
jgi:Sec7-like guanine-nucleotide exchange factor